MSLAVNGMPSCQVTPSRNGKVSSVPSSFHDQPVARSGTTDCGLVCGTCWSNMTRLLKTPIIGPSAKTVDSSWIDMLAGLSGLYILKIPPCFWANAVSARDNASKSAPAAASWCRSRLISGLLFEDGGRAPRHCILAGPLLGSRARRSVWRLSQSQRGDHDPKMGRRAGGARCRGLLVEPDVL